MLNIIGKGRMNTREVLFQIVLYIVVFVFYCFDRHHPNISIQELVYFSVYTIAALVINYWLLPQLYYHKRYILFLISCLLLIALVIIIEELVLEPIYFPGKIANTFPGIFFSLAQILPVITILVGFKFAWDAVTKQHQLDELRMTAQESELEFLKSQINPHFLFNNLNNLYSYAIENSPKTPTIILELSGVLRYILYECKEKFVPLTKELGQLENFTRLSELQIEERGAVLFKAPTISGNFQIAPLILSVFIENAFKHSQSSQSTGIFIEIEISISSDGKLDFYCKNSFNPTTNTDDLSQGIGLENVKKRLELIYPQAHILNIQKEENTYEVHLTLQLSKGELS